jgi:hypothetical protein
MRKHRGMRFPPKDGRKTAMVLRSYSSTPRRSRRFRRPNCSPAVVLASSWATTWSSPRSAPAAWAKCIRPSIGKFRRDDGCVAIPRGPGFDELARLEPEPPLAGRQQVENATSFVSIAPLKDCKNLSKLTLHGGAVDGPEFALLSGFTQLLELQLNTPSITEAQVKQLSAALPRCKITWRDAANKSRVFEPTAPPATK